MEKAMNNFTFKCMILLFKIRDLIVPREKIFMEVEIQKGFHILDYGCGPGSYSIIAAGLAGDSGKVYSVDTHPLALESVKKRASKKGISSIETILSNCKTGLGDNSIDVVFLFDVFHDLPDPGSVLKELYRVMKKDANLSFSDHHMNEKTITEEMKKSGLFKLEKKGDKTYTFTKAAE